MGTSQIAFIEVGQHLIMGGSTLDGQVVGAISIQQWERVARENHRGLRESGRQGDAICVVMV